MVAELDPKIIKLNESTLARLSALDKSKVYIIGIKITDRHSDVKMAIASKLKSALDQSGVEAVIIPNDDFEHQMLRVNELSKYLQK